MDFKAALDMLVEQIVAIVNKMLESAPFDKTYTGIVKGCTTISEAPVFKLDVEVEGKIRSIESNVQIIPNTIIKILVPKNNWDKAQILITDKLLLDKVPINRLTLSTNTDLNNVVDAGSYVLSGSNTYTNMPSSYSYGILVVDRAAPNSSFINQTYYHPANHIMWIRGTQNGGTSWGAWEIISQSHYMCDVYYSGSGDATFNGDIVFNNVVRNIGNCYSTSNGRFTCPVDGIYLVAFSFYSNATAATPRATIRISGNQRMQVNGPYGKCITDIVYCTKGQYITAGALSSSYPITIYAGNLHNRFTVSLLQQFTV